MSNDDDWATIGLEKVAIPANFDRPIPGIWTTSEMDDGAPSLHREDNPFADLTDRAVAQQTEHKDIYSQLVDKADDIAGLQNELFTASLVPGVENADQALSDLRSRVNVNQSDEHALKDELESQTEETVDLIDLFQEKSSKTASPSKPPPHRKGNPQSPLNIGDRVQDEQGNPGTITSKDGEGYTVRWDGNGDPYEEFSSPHGLRKLSAKEPKKVVQDEPHSHRVEKATKGMEVITPNGPGKVEDVYDEGRSVLVRLTDSASLRPYRTNRLSKLAKNKILSEAAACEVCQQHNGHYVDASHPRPPYHKNCKCKEIEAKRKQLAKQASPLDGLKVGDSFVDPKDGTSHEVSEIDEDGNIITETGEVLSHGDYAEGPRRSTYMDRLYMNEDGSQEQDEPEADDNMDAPKADKGLGFDPQEMEDQHSAGADWASDHEDASYSEAVSVANELANDMWDESAQDQVMEGILSVLPDLKKGKGKKSEGLKKNKPVS